MKVNEIFGPTIQGEGPSQGKEVMFVRLALCNLKCVWCDTKYTWDWEHYDYQKEVHPLDIDSILKVLSVSNCKSVVISGGEPMLQQVELVKLCKALFERDYWIEIETNGTIIPGRELITLVDQFNCSPKLSNSGDSREKRMRADALFALSIMPTVFFKFVIGRKLDVEEVLEYVKLFQLNPHHVYLMPLGMTREELALTTEMTRELASKHHFNFSSRLHVELYGTKRGV